MDQRYTRRDVARLLGAGALGLALSSALRAGDAGAAIRWCRTDPVVKIDGRTADILLGSYDTLHETATGPAEIVITIPNTSTGELLATDRGWGGHGYQVSFVRSDKLTATGSDTPVRIETYVPSRDGALPLVVDFLPRSSGLAKASVEGTVNAWVLLRTQ